LLPLLLLISPAQAQTPKRIITYYRAADQQNTLAYNSSNIPYARLTHVIHVTLQLSSSGDGSISVLPGDVEPNLTPLAHAAGNFVLVSPRGTAAEFSILAKSPTARFNSHRIL
jgi:GH18 family chitinase